MNTRERIGKKLSQIRRRRGLSTYDVEKATGISASNVTRVEKGRHSAGVDTVDRLAQAVGYTVDLVPTETQKNQGVETPC